MACKRKYTEVGCEYVGELNTLAAVCPDDTVVKINTRFDDFFPASIPENEYFHATMYDSCSRNCEDVIVTSVNDGVLTLVRPNPSKECFGAASRIAYTTTSVGAIEDISRDVGINVEPPLIYNCDTHTLSIDCDELQRMMARRTETT